jgi:carboxylesterase
MPFQPEYEVPEERQSYTFFGKPREGWERIGCLVLHGFMGSPVSSRDMAKHIAEGGVTAHCPLLPGHGNLPYEIHGHSGKEWLAEADEAFDFLSRHCDQIFIIGHSMGASLAAYLANKHPDVCGLILLAPLYKVPDWRINLAAFGRYFMPWIYPLKHEAIDRDIFIGRVTDFDPTIDVDDPELQDWLFEATRIPVDGTDEMRKMARFGRKLWPKIHQPVIIFQGGHDPAVSPGNTEKLFQLLSTADKEMKFFPQVGHELMRPVEPIHKKVWQKVDEFIEEHAEIGEKKPTVLNAPSLLVQKDDGR